MEQQAAGRLRCNHVPHYYPIDEAGAAVPHCYRAGYSNGVHQAMDRYGRKPALRQLGCHSSRQSEVGPARWFNRTDQRTPTAVIATKAEKPSMKSSAAEVDNEESHATPDRLSTYIPSRAIK